jgi:glutamate/tyrosine decarboxylase-like PLP-dependent enzyme
MAPAHLNIVCFRVRQGSDEEVNDALTATVTERIQSDGIAFVTATRWRNRGAIRAAFDNWATSTDDVLALERAVAGAVAAVSDAR